MKQPQKNKIQSQLKCNFTLQTSSSSNFQKKQIVTMFNKISHRYDLLNHLLSFNLDIYWRKKAIQLLQNHCNHTILDIATGTGDLAFLAAKKLHYQKIFACDIAENMLQKAKKKSLKNQIKNINFQYGDAEQLVFDNNYFNSVISAFGIRNFNHLPTCFTEMYRVLKKEGNLMLMEFSIPKKLSLIHI